MPQPSDGNKWKSVSEEDTIILNFRLFLHFFYLNTMSGVQFSTRNRRK